MSSGTVQGWLISQSVVAMCRHIEAMHGRSWVEVLGSNRNFSECMLYGRYVDEVEVRPSITHTDRELCRIYWEGPGLDHNGLLDFVGGLEPHQVAVGIQSFGPITVSWGCPPRTAREGRNA